jgi:hypothetical protein
MATPRSSSTSALLPNPPIRPSRRALVRGAAWATPTALVSVAAPAMAVSPLNCQEPGTLFDAQARGIFLSGSLGGVDLDNVAALQGAHARAFDPVADGATSTVEDQDSAGLDISVLSTLNLSLSGLAGTVSDILDFTAGQKAGVLNQYGYANEAVGQGDSAEIGASGAVGDNSGTITLSKGDPKAPELGTINLYTLLKTLTRNQAVAALVDDISALDLVLGAVAGRAQMDSLCATPKSSELQRDYLIAYARLVVASDVVGTLLSRLTTTLSGGISVSTDALLGALRPIPVLGPLLAGVGSALAQVKSTITVNTNSLTDTPIPAESGTALRVDLGKSQIILDLETLLDGGLNGQSPNTRLFIDAGLADGSTQSLLDQWTDALVERVTALVSVDISITVAGIVRVTAKGTLKDLLAGEGAIAVQVPRLLGGWQDLAGVSLPTVAKAIGGVVQGSLDALFNTGGALATALDGVNTLLGALFTVLQDVIVITVNAQNEASGVEPAYFQAITPVGRYDVAAIHMQAIGALNLLNLTLARGSAGENEPRS